jgi:murein DD-endopeptidase MepM/ murein hydrolase activator NlpD
MERITIGPIADRVILRPGISDTKNPPFIPNPEHQDYWRFIVEYITERTLFQIPVPNADYLLNPFFGSFGMCYNPSSVFPRSFHLGLDLATRHREAVKPIVGGVLEYSGYSLANGHYVMLSHPEITSEDGFILYSLYISLHSAAVGFTRYQKMLREISMRSYPEIMIGSDTVIGYVGESGDTAGLHTHMHIQTEFRHPDSRVIAMDPAQFLNLPADGNITTEITNANEFQELYPMHEDEIKKARLIKYWKK